MRSPVLLLLLLATSLACARPESAATEEKASADSAAARQQEVITAAEQASAAGEPDTPRAPADQPVASEADRVAGPAAPGPGAAAPQQPPAADSAARILEEASARYAGIRSLQADFAMSYENPLLRSRTSGAGVLYQKRPDRLLLRFSEPAGDVILSDGQYFWVYYPSVDAAQVIRTAAGPASSSGVDLQAQFLGDPTRRFEYHLDGEQPVSGRAAWLLTLKPRQPLGYRQLRVWIDKRDHLARRFEITEDNGSVRRFELTGLRLDPALSDNLFRFDVPAGVRVITR